MSIHSIVIPGSQLLFPCLSQRLWHLNEPPPESTRALEANSPSAAWLVKIFSENHRIIKVGRTFKSKPPGAAGYEQEVEPHLEDVFTLFPPPCFHLAAPGSGCLIQKLSCAPWAALTTPLPGLGTPAPLFPQHSCSEIHSLKNLMEPHLNQALEKCRQRKPSANSNLRPVPGFGAVSCVAHWLVPMDDLLDEAPSLLLAWPAPPPELSPAWFLWQTPAQVALSRFLLPDSASAHSVFFQSCLWVAQTHRVSFVSSLSPVMINCFSYSELVFFFSCGTCASFISKNATSPTFFNYSDRF